LQKESPGNMYKRGTTVDIFIIFTQLNYPLEWRLSLLYGHCFIAEREALYFIFEREALNFILEREALYFIFEREALYFIFEREALYFILEREALYFIFHGVQSYLP
jgi:hypothetical protein